MGGNCFQRRRFVLRGFAVRLVAGVLCVLLSGAPLVRAQRELPSEYEVKAAFLYNFAKFVEWPADTHSNPSAPIRLCVLGEDPFGRILDRAVQDKSINGHELTILRSRQAQELRACHILFISASEKKHLPEIFAALQGSSVLSVGDTEQFAELGGTIQFTLQDNRVRFTINLDAAERARLKISSKLLSLARVVHDDTRRGGD
jgi:hypothetical protein